MMQKTLQKLSTTWNWNWFNLNLIELINGKRSWGWGTCWTKTSKCHFPSAEVQQWAHFRHQLLPHPHSPPSCKAWNSSLHVLQLYPMDSELHQHQTQNNNFSSPQFRIFITILIKPNILIKTNKWPKCISRIKSRIHLQFSIPQTK